MYFGVVMIRFELCNNHGLPSSYKRSNNTHAHPLLLLRISSVKYCSRTIQQALRFWPMT